MAAARPSPERATLRPQAEQTKRGQRRPSPAAISREARLKELGARSTAVGEAFLAAIATYLIAETRLCKLESLALTATQIRPAFLRRHTALCAMSQVRQLCEEFEKWPGSFRARFPKLRKLSRQQ